MAFFRAFVSIFKINLQTNQLKSNTSTLMKKYLYFLLYLFALPAFSQTYPIPLEKDYSIVYEFHEGFAAVRRNELWGFIDKTGREVVPCKYKNVEKMRNGRAIVKTQSSHYGAINSKGEEIIPCIYRELSDFKHGFAKFRRSEYFRYGIIDSMGKEIILDKYDYLSNADFSKGFVIARFQNKYGLINQKEETIIEFKYHYIKRVAADLYAVEVEDTVSTSTYYRSFTYRSGLMNQKGQEIIPCKYEEIWSFDNELLRFYEDLAPVKRGKKYGFINKEGLEVIPCKYDNANSFAEGFAWVVLDKKITFIDKTGKEVIPFYYNASFWEDRGRINYDISSFWEGLAEVKSPTNGKFGYIDTTGKVIIPFQYDKARSYDNNIAAVAQKSAWALIDKQGNTLTPFKYDQILYFFAKNIIEVESNGHRQFINREGKELTEGKYDAAWRGGQELIQVKLGEMNGFVDENGAEVVPTIYERATNFSEGLAAVKKAGVWYLITKP